MDNETLFSASAYRAKPLQLRGTLISTAAHAAILSALLVSFHHAARIIPYRLPGTAKGVSYLTFYSAGSTATTVSQSPLKKQAAAHSTPTTHAPLPTPKPLEASTPSSEVGASNAALSGKGEGNISIALQKVFPYPKPDLSSLPHGTHGDVILDAVIDQNGNIANLTLVQGLGPAIDNVVIATVRQWSYTPALMNGAPVASEQELHFHYEHS